MRKGLLSKIMHTLLAASLLWMPAHSLASANACHTVLSTAAIQGLTWGEGFNFELAEATLRSQKSFRKIIPMTEYLKSLGKKESGTTEVYYVEFQNGLRAVWKPDEYLNGPIAEEAAYQVARKLGVKTFVPTIVTEIEGRMGSLSVFVETPVDLVAMEGDARNSFIAKIPQKQWADMELVHFLLGQWDRHAGNLLVDQNHNLIVIDNEGISKLSIFQLGQSPMTQTGTVPKEERNGLDIKENRPVPLDRMQYLNGDDPQAVHDFITKYSIKPEILQFKQFKPFPEHKLPYLIWRDKLWRKRMTRSLPVIELKVLSASTVAALAKLSEADLRALLNPEVFSEMHIEFIMQRRAVILQQAKLAQIIP